MKIYILSAACISPQPTFNFTGLFTHPVSYTTNRLKLTEPDYKAYIDAKLIRRMSRIIKLGVAAALQCLRDADIDMPDAIITGTAYGCLEDTGIFMTRIVEQEEEMLSPTSFIQSTHNTVGAQIALGLQCHNYNNTFTQQGHSFESALLDALLLFKEQEICNALVGSADELTDISFDIFNRFGLYRRSAGDSLQLLQTRQKGTIAGEGTAFFALTTATDTKNMAELQAMETFYNVDSGSEVQEKIKAFLEQQNLPPEAIGLIISGNNGDTENDKIYEQLQQGIFSGVPVAGYKHLCGEYPTSISFALWLAAVMLKEGNVPPSLNVNPARASPVKQVLIYNHYQYRYHTLLLLKVC